MGAYIATAGIAEDKNAPLFRTTRGKTKELTRNPMTRVDVFRTAAGLPLLSDAQAA